MLIQDINCIHFGTAALTQDWVLIQEWALAWDTIYLFDDLSRLQYYDITLAFCKNNCAETGSSGCITCKTGYISEPECCECDTTGNATHAFYKTPSEECKRKCNTFLTIDLDYNTIVTLLQLSARITVLKLVAVGVLDAGLDLSLCLNVVGVETVLKK